MKKTLFLLLLFLFSTMVVTLFSVDLSQGFEGTTFPPDGWTVINAGDPNTWERTNARSHSGSYSASILFEANAHDDWLISHRLAPTASNHTYAFWAANEDMEFPEVFNVKLSTTGIEKANFTVTLGSNLVPGTDFQQYSFDLNAYVGQNVYVAIQAISRDMWQLFIDDISGPPLAWETEPSNHVTNFTAFQTSADTVTLSWTGSTGTQLPIKYLILVKNTVGSYANVADGTPVSDDTIWSNGNLARNVSHAAGTNTYIFSGFSVGDVCSIRIYPYTNYGTNINFLTSTPVPETSVGISGSWFSEGFEGSAFPPSGWTVYNEGDLNTWFRSTSYSQHSGNAYASIEYNDVYAHDDWLVTPRVAPTQANHVFSFWSRNQSDTRPECFNVKLSTTDNQITSFATTLGSNQSPGATYFQYSYDLTPFIGQNIYLAIQAITLNGFYLHIDDVAGPPLTLSTEPSNFPTSFVASGHNYRSITLSWTGSTGEVIPIRYLILAKKAGGTYTTVADGIPVPDDNNWTDNNGAVNVDHHAGTNTYSFSGLSYSTSYDFVIYPYANSASSIDFKTDGIAPTVSASTDASPVISSFPYNEDFEGNWQGSPSAPDNWNQLSTSGDHPWYRAQYDVISGSYIAFAEDSGNGGNHLLITPALNLGTRNYRLKFLLKGAQYGPSLKVQISPNANSPSDFTTTLAFYNSVSNMPTTWTQLTLDLSEYEGTQYIAFRMIDTESTIDWIKLDQIVIDEIPPDPATLVDPVDIATDIILHPTLTWADGSGNPTGYKLYFGTDGNGTASPTNIANNLDMGANLSYYCTTLLAPHTVYYWQIVPYNSGGNASNCPIRSFTTIGPEVIAGNCLEFDGTGDNVTGTGINTALSAFTIELWVNHSVIPEGIVERYITLEPEVAVLRYDGTTYGDYRSLHFYIKKSNGSLASLRADSVLVTGEWMHIAGTYDGTNLKLYLNGTLVKSSVPAGGLYAPTGTYRFGGSTETLSGKLDEMRIWNYARSATQIRESMHHSQSGTASGLLHYWQFNKSMGTSVPDVIGGCDGTLNNMMDADWVVSSTPFGTGVSYTHAEATGVVTFTGTDLSMNYTAHNSASVTVSKLNTNPNLIPTAVNAVFYNQYWIVSRYGTGTFNGNMTLTVSEDLTVDDQLHPNQIRLYYRSRGSDGNWGVIASAISVNASLNQATFYGISDTGQFLICRNYPTISNLNGTALTFDGVNDYVNLGNSSSFNTGDYITIEAWIKPNSLAGRSGIFSTRLNNLSGSFQLEVGGGSGGTGRVAVSGINTWVAQTGDNAVTTGEWIHIAYTRSGLGTGGESGLQSIYVNGVSQTITTTNSYSFVANSSDKLIGGGTSGGQLFNGAMDEIRVWSVPRTEDQIRQNMYIPLTGTETGLISYWQCNEASGTILNDYITLINGTMMNMGNENWITSVFPFSSGVSNSQFEALGYVTFTGTGLSSYFSTVNGARFTVSKLSSSPNVVPTGVDTVFDNQYWVMNRYGTGSFSANLTFTINEDIYPSEESNPGNIQLYTRSSRSSGGWTLLASASSVNSADNKVTFESISTEGQFILVRQNPLSVDIPLNITLELQGSNPKLSWDAVSGATSYKIFSCNSPNGTFVEATSSGTFSRNIDKGMKSRATWTSSTAGIDRMFYYVKAVR